MNPVGQVGDNFLQVGRVLLSAAMPLSRRMREKKSNVDASYPVCYFFFSLLLLSLLSVRCFNFVPFSDIDAAELSLIIFLFLFYVITDWSSKYPHTLLLLLTSIYGTFLVLFLRDRQIG